ncbi:DUF3592 domain-containing protein [Gemmata sp.]|uniref:DUF3592 domain-containing protein n=1 Tax=Gemmata sp. TaxID=1914242 RepID=UPI003F7151F8
MIDHRLGFGLFFLSGGLLAIAGGAERRRQKRALVRRAVRVTARVVSVRTESTNDAGGVDFHYPTLEFRVAGKVARADAVVGRLDGGEVSSGKEVTAYYDPLDPGRVVLAPGDWPGGGCATILGLAVAGTGGALLWAWLAGR